MIRFSCCNGWLLHVKIGVVKSETELGEYYPVAKEVVYPYRKRHERWNLEAPGGELGQRAQRRN